MIQTEIFDLFPFIHQKEVLRRGTGSKQNSALTELTPDCFRVQSYWSPVTLSIKSESNSSAGDEELAAAESRVLKLREP